MRFVLAFLPLILVAMATVYVMAMAGITPPDYPMTYIKVCFLILAAIAFVGRTFFSAHPLSFVIIGWVLAAALSALLMTERPISRLVSDYRANQFVKNYYQHHGFYDPQYSPNVDTYLFVNTAHQLVMVTINKGWFPLSMDFMPAGIEEGSKIRTWAEGYVTEGSFEGNLKNFYSADGASIYQKYNFQYDPKLPNATTNFTSFPLHHFRNHFAQ